MSKVTLNKASNRLEARKASPILISISAVILGLFAGCLLILAIGKNPIVGFQKLLYGSLNGTRRVGNTLANATQLILVGLSVGFAFKTGLFNIGGSGQMLIGGLFASIFAVYVKLPPILLYPSLILIAGISGAIWGLIVGFLKAKFNVHEVVGTIMLNWIAYWLVYDFVPRFIGDPSIKVKSIALTNSETLRTDWMINLTNRSFLNYGIVIAIIAVFVVWFILEKTTLGFSLKAVGSNKYCAEFAGIKVNKNIIISMAIAGALAGLAGLTYFLGYSNHMEIGKSPAEGFDGIAVALLGNSNPFGVLFAALFFGVLKMGKGSLSATGIPTEIADTIIATIIYFTATSVLLKNFWDGLFKKRYEKKMSIKEEK